MGNWTLIFYRMRVLFVLLFGLLLALVPFTSAGKNIDSDGDGLTDIEDDDDDNDGLLDSEDDDGDGILDGDEDDDGDGLENDEDPDDDGDGVLDEDDEFVILIHIPIVKSQYLFYLKCKMVNSH